MPPAAFRTDDAGPVTVRRFDVGGDLLHPVKRDSDGAMLLEGVPVREGVLVYRQADGSERRELVTRQAVEDTARTLARAPVTLEHPDSGMVTPDTAASVVVGDVDGSVAVEEDELGGFARVRIAVRRRDALDAITGGTVELSPGYEVDIDETPGEHPIFGRYDARQVGRRGNHLAIVSRGRGGPTVRLRTDSTDAVQVGRQDPITPASTRRTDSEARMRTLPLLLAALGIEQRYDSDEAAVDAAIPVAKRLKADADKRADADEDKEKADAESEKLKAENEKLKADMEKLQGEYDALKGKQDEMEAEAKQKADAAELAQLQALAGKVGVKHDGLDLPALRVAVAKTRVPKLDSETSPERIDGILAVIAADADKPRADRWDWGHDDDGSRTDAEDKTFFNPYLDAADDARGARDAGGAK